MRSNAHVGRAVNINESLHEFTQRMKRCLKRLREQPHVLLKEYLTKKTPFLILTYFAIFLRWWWTEIVWYAEELIIFHYKSLIVYKRLIIM